MSFDAYRHWGSFEKASEVARTSTIDTIDQWRTILFMKCRASRHRGDDEFVESFKSFRPILLELVADCRE